jgi:hypothetical protein
MRVSSIRSSKSLPHRAGLSGRCKLGESAIIALA